MAKIIRNGSPMHTAFENIRKGDTVFVNGKPVTVTVDSHYSGDASYDGYLLYAGDDGYFPEDLDG